MNLKSNARKKHQAVYTHEGAPAKNISAVMQLRRSVMSTMLFEDTFYESGQTIADRIVDLAGRVEPSQVAQMATQARTEGNLRHVPLLLAYTLTKTAAGTSLPSETIASVIQRADEIPEFVALYMKYCDKHPKTKKGILSKQAKLGLAAAFNKFDEYQFSKWDRKDAAWRLRDVMFLAHPKPKDGKQKALFEAIANDTLKPAKTWEVQLSKAGQTATTQEEKQVAKKGILSKQAKLGLAAAFNKFDEYQFSKWDRKDAAWRLRDVMFLAHPKPKDGKQKALFEAIANDTLKPAKTWEVQLSKAGQTATTQEEKQVAKKDVFEKQLNNGKLGYLALLRNLRGMLEAGVDKNLIKTSILARHGAHKVLPFRFVAAARAAPQLELQLDTALCDNINEMPALKGRTVILVDVSYSMVGAKVSAKSDMDRVTAAATLASVINAEDLRVFSFSNGVVEVPPRRGVSGVDAILRSQSNGGTYLGAAIKTIHEKVPHDRLIVITDEQSNDRIPDPIAKYAYMINIAPYQNGVGYGMWTQIDGFSEYVIRFITELENLEVERA